MGPATETTTMTDVLLKAIEENSLESSFKMFLEGEKYKCTEMEAVRRLQLLGQGGVFSRAQKGIKCSPEDRASWGGEVKSTAYTAGDWA